jgi:hypothetical protein
MDFMSRGQANPQAPQHQKKSGMMSRILRIETFTVIVGSALLIAAVALFLGLTNSGNESKKVNTKEYQAVFLNNGQVYFGKVKDLNAKYVDLTNIFYIENNSQNTGTTSAQNTNYTLRKLGTTELHAPEDEMIINRDQVTFWENLKDSGQVVQKINEYYKNPSAASSSSTPAATTPTTTTPTTKTTP